MNTKQITLSILLVDDKRTNLIATKLMLVKTGAKIRLAQSGAEALEILKNQEMAAIILDVQMPGMNGFETAARIKQIPLNESTPIIFLTAYGRDELTKAKGYSTGAIDYLHKPVDPTILINKTNAFIELYSNKKLVDLQKDEIRKQERDLKQFTKFLTQDISQSLNRTIKSLNILNAHEQFSNNPQFKAAFESGNELNHLLLNMISYLSVDQQKRTPKFIELVPFIEQKTRSFSEGAYIDLNIPENTLLEYPQRDMQDIIERLIENSIQHSDHKPTIKISCKEKKDKFILTIEDNGPGIDKKLLKQAFSFGWSKVADGNIGGLGLAIVKKMVTLNQGRLWIKTSASNGGTSVYFTIPKKSESQQTIDKINTNPLSIHIIDREFTSRRFAQTILEDHQSDNKISFSKNGMDAIDFLERLENEEDVPEFILVDMQQQGQYFMNHYSEIENLFPDKKMKVILLAEETDLELLKQKYSEKIVDDIWTKPIRKQPLLNLFKKQD